MHNKRRLPRIREFSTRLLVSKLRWRYGVSVRICVKFRSYQPLLVEITTLFVYDDSIYYNHRISPEKLLLNLTSTSLNRPTDKSLPGSLNNLHTEKWFI